MYSSYSSLQQSQLAAQGYYDTQSTYLLVYAPGRNTALRATLVAFLTLTGMVMLGGVAAAEAVMLSQVVPYIILTALRACYLESVWRVAGPVRTA